MANRVCIVEVPEADRRELQRRARSKGVPARVVERARIVLLAADGVPGKQIAAQVSCAEPTVVTWRRPPPSGAWPDLKMSHGRGNRRRCRRRCGIGCWS